jgi:CMP-N-acetylneuraminic acid synthetase
MVEEENYDSVFSVCRQKKFRWSESSSSCDSSSSCHRSTTTTTRPLNFDPCKRPRRQDWAGDLVENGMFYFAKRGLVVDNNLLQGGKKCAHVEVDSKLSLEIDSSLDLALAEQIVLHEGIEPYTVLPQEMSLA